MPNFTPTTNAVAIPTVIAQETIRLLPSYMGVARFVSKDTDWTGQDFASYGDTLEVVNPGALTVKTKTPGTPIVTQSPTADKVSVTLDTHSYISILQEDITKLLQKPDLQQKYAQNMAIKLAESIESKIYALHPTVQNTITFSPVTTEAEIDAAFRRLRDKFARLKVPKGEEKAFFQDTSITSNLLSVTKYTSGDYVNGKGIIEGAVNRVHGINNVETQLIPTSGSPVAYHNLALTKWGIVLVSRPMPLDGNGRGARQFIVTDPNTGLNFRMTEAYDYKEMGTAFTLDVLTGAAVADQNQVIEVESF